MPAKPPVKHRFKPGQSGNPQGARLHNPLFKKVKSLTLEAYCELIQEVALQAGEHVVELARDLKGQNLLGTLSACWLVARKKGDYDTIEKILSRVLGKIPDEINLNSKNLNANLNATIDDKLMKAAMKALEEKV